MRQPRCVHAALSRSVTYSSRARNELTPSADSTLRARSSLSVPAARIAALFASTVQVRRTAIAARSASRASAAHVTLTPPCRFGTSRRVLRTAQSPPSSLAPFNGATTASRAQRQRASHSHESTAGRTTASRQHIATASLLARQPRGTRTPASARTAHAIVALTCFAGTSRIHQATCIM